MTLFESFLNWRTVKLVKIYVIFNLGYDKSIIHTNVLNIFLNHK